MFYTFFPKNNILSTPVSVLGVPEVDQSHFLMKRPKVPQNNISLKQILKILCYLQQIIEEIKHVF